MLSRSMVKRGGTSTSTNSHFGRAHRPRHQVGAERAVAAARCPPTAHWNSLTPLVRIILQLHLSSLCASAVVVLCRYDTAAGCGVCQARSMLGDYKPMIWTAKMYGTFHHIPTLAKLLSPFIKKILAFGVYFGELVLTKRTFANTLAIGKKC